MVTIELPIIVAVIVVVIVVVIPIAADYNRQGRVVRLGTTLSCNISFTATDMLVIIIDSAELDSLYLSFGQLKKN